MEIDRRLGNDIKTTTGLHRHSWEKTFKNANFRSAKTIIVCAERIWCRIGRIQWKS